MEPLIEAKLFGSFALTVASGSVFGILDVLAKVGFPKTGEISKFYNLEHVLLVLLVLLPNSVDPAELAFIKDIIYGHNELMESDVDIDYGELMVDEIASLSDSVLFSQLENSIRLLNEKAAIYHWNWSELQQYASEDPEQCLIAFVKARTLKISHFHDENLYFNEEMFQLIPKNGEFSNWKSSFLVPLNFKISYNIHHGIMEPIPDVVRFEEEVSKQNFDYLIKYLDHVNANEFLINCVVPYIRSNGVWSLLLDWLVAKQMVTEQDYQMGLKIFEFFFNNYLVTQDQDDAVLDFLNSFIEEYLYKVYCCNLLTDNTLAVLSETVQYCIINHEYFTKYEPEPRTTDKIDSSMVDDAYIRKYFCSNSLENLQLISSLIDSISKLIKVTNNNESLMSIVQVLLLCISSSQVQLNFAKLLIHNFRINDDESNIAFSYNNWETFLVNFNWLVQYSVIFKKIQTVNNLNKINEIIFEIMLSKNFNSLIKKYLLINFSSNPNLKQIMLKHCWWHYLKADNFNLEKGELLVSVEFLKNYDLDFDKEIQNANNFFVINKNKLDIYNNDDDSKFVEFDTSLVNGKPLKAFIKPVELDPIQSSKEFTDKSDLDFEIIKFKKLLISCNQLIINFKFSLSNKPLKPIDIYMANNPLLVMDKILELNPKSYTEMNKIYKILVDLCIGLDKVGLVYNVVNGETKNGDQRSEHEDAVLPLKDKLISSCINSALIDLNFDFAYNHSMRLLSNETGHLQSSFSHIWLSIFQVCKFIDPAWITAAFDDDDEYSEDPVPLDVLTRQIELISKLLEVGADSSISAIENKIILSQAGLLLTKYRKKLDSQVVNDFNRYQYQQSGSIFKNFNASTGTLLNQFKNASNINITNNSALTVGRRSQFNPQDSINSSPISAFESPRNSSLEPAGSHSALRLGGAQGLENRFVRAFASSASEIFSPESPAPTMSQSQSSGRLNLLAGEEQIKNLFVSGLGWAIGANQGENKN